MLDGCIYSCWMNLTGAVVLKSLVLISFLPAYTYTYAYSCDQSFTSAHHGHEYHGNFRLSLTCSFSRV